MMAYAALISLRQIVDSILHPAAGGRRFSHNRAQLKFLLVKVSFLLDFLENSAASHNGKSKDPELHRLETMIRDAAYAAEDAIESDIHNQLHPKTGNTLSRCVDLLFGAGFNFAFFSIWIKVFSRRVFLSVIYDLLTTVQPLLPISFQHVIYVVTRVSIPLTVHILEPCLFLILTVALLSVIKPALVELMSLWLYAAYQPENEDLRVAIFLMADAIEFKEERGLGQDRQNQPHHHVHGLSRRDFRGTGKNVVVGLDSDLKEIFARLSGYPPELQTVSIVGMGGIGKTTLSRKVYDDPHLLDHFDMRAWATVSQEYSLRCVLLGLLDSAKIRTEDILKNHIGGDDELDYKLGEHLYKNLKNRRYLIVVDDMWDTEIWDFLRRFFPDDQNGSRVLLTTRLSEVASYANSGGSPPLQIQFLNDGDGWHLLREKVFGGDDCPRGLEGVGKEIARNCRGLPLAIVVVGGLLYHEHRTEGDWARVSKDLHSILSEDEQCLEILGLSYNHLPLCLKPCFLYMGAFQEEIPVAKLFNLWIAEGFVEPRKSVSLEEVAEEYLNDLIQRSLIMVGKGSCNGKIRTCKIHDRLRDVCMRIAHEEKFLDLVHEDEVIGHGGHGGDLFDFANDGEIDHVSAFANGEDEEIGRHVGAKSQRRLITHVGAFACIGRRSSFPMARSLICFGKLSHVLPDFYLGFKLLRVLDIVRDCLYEFPDAICTLVFLRYLGLTYDYPLPPSIARLWNLQTIVFYNASYVRGLPIPVEIWSMLNLRHIYFTAHLLPHPPALHPLRSNPVLENLQTLVGISDLRFTKDILKSMPNLKKLGISYDARTRVDWSEYQLQSLVNLHRLESLKITVRNDNCSPSAVHLPKLAFPQKLERLTLGGCLIHWESMSAVGALPNLQVLKLTNHACQGEDWEPVEGQFCLLKFLLLEDSDLAHWRCDDTHFPLLQRLILRRCNRLQEVPSGMGEIATLERMELVDCHPSAVESAQLIREQQEEMGNEVLKLSFKKQRFDRCSSGARRQMA